MISSSMGPYFNDDVVHRMAARSMCPLFRVFSLINDQREVISSLVQDGFS